MRSPVRTSARRCQETLQVSNTALRSEALSLGYGTGLVVNEVSVALAAGRITVLIGPNGSGKSTLVKGLVGLLKPLSGRVLLGGGDDERDLTGVPPNRAVRFGLGYVPQVANTFVSLTVRENLLVGAFTKPAQLKVNLEKVLDMFPDLATGLSKPARSLSGGQRGMLGLARALMSEPRVILVDEPTAGLSPRYHKVVWEHLRKLSDSGVGVLVVEQNTRAALERGDHGYILVQGQVGFEGPCADLLGNSSLRDLYIGA